MSGRKGRFFEKTFKNQIALEIIFFIKLRKLAPIRNQQINSKNTVKFLYLEQQQRLS